MINLNFRATGQFPPQECLNFDNCMDQKEYYAAYQCIVLEDKKDLEEMLIVTIVLEDRYDAILDISSSLKNDEEMAFLFKAACEYFRVDNMKRVYAIYGLLNASYRSSLSTKLLVNQRDPNKKNQIIDNILNLHLLHDDIPGAIAFVRNITRCDRENHLFKLGLDLIHAKKWENCNLILEALTTKKLEYKVLVKLALRTNVSFIRA